MTKTTRSEQKVFIPFSSTILKYSSLVILSMMLASVITASAAPIAAGHIPGLSKLATLKKEGLTKLELHRLERSGKFIIGHSRDGMEVLVRANSRFASRANKAALSANPFALAVNTGGNSLNFTVKTQSNGRIILSPDVEKQSDATYTPTPGSSQTKPNPVPNAAIQVAVQTAQELVDSLIPGLFIGLVNSQEAVHPQNLTVLQTSTEDDPSLYSSYDTPVPVSHSADAKITLVSKKTTPPQNH